MPLDRTNRSLYIDRTDPDNPLGISPQEIAECLQDYRVDKLGNVDVGMMCTSPKINGWNKNKPVTWPSWTYIKEIDYAYRGIDGLCGLNIPMIDNDDFLQGYDYVLEKIKGLPLPSFVIPSPPYRVDDFDGYLHGRDINGVFGWGDSSYIYTGDDAKAWTLQIATFATNAGSLALETLSLVDLMQRFSNKINWTDIESNESYGYLGVVLLYTGAADTTDGDKMMALCSHSCKVTSATGESPYEIVLDFDAIYNEEGGTQAIKNNSQGYLIPCICNYNTDGQWVALGENSSVNYLECMILPFSGYTYKGYTFKVGSTPITYDKIIVFAVYGGTVASNKKSFSINRNYPYIGVTLEYTDSLLADTQYYVMVTGSSGQEVYADYITFSASTRRASLPQLNTSEFKVGSTNFYSGNIYVYETEGSNTVIGNINIS